MDDYLEKYPQRADGVRPQPASALAAPILPPPACRPGCHPVLRRRAADRAGVLRALLPGTAARRRLHRHRAGHHPVAVLDAGTVRRRRARPLVAPADPGRRRSEPCRCWPWRWPRWSPPDCGPGDRGDLLRDRAAGDEPEPVPARRAVGLAAAHHRRRGVHGRQRRGAHRRAGRNPDRRRASAPRCAWCWAGSMPDYSANAILFVVAAGGLRAQRVPRPADPAPPARTGRRHAAPAPRHRGRAGRGAGPPPEPHARLESAC